MKATATQLDWEDLSPKNKLKLAKTPHLFLAGHRELSEARISQVQKLLEKSGADILWGQLKDDYIPGLEGGEIFRTHKLGKFIKESKQTKILNYWGRNWKYILAELKFSGHVLFHGSQARMLHLREEYWKMLKSNRPLKLISNFSSKDEAINYTQQLETAYTLPKGFEIGGNYSDTELLALTEQIALRSYDWTFRAGAVLSKNGKLIAVGHNRVLPYQTYTLHSGSRKEEQFSPPQDQNYYDTNHAEMEVLVEANRQKISLKGCSLYVNLMPCEGCARVLARTGLKEIKYNIAHEKAHSHELLSTSGIDLTEMVATSQN